MLIYTHIVNIPDALLVVNVGLEKLNHFGLGAGLDDQRAALEFKAFSVVGIGGDITENSTWEVGRYGLDCKHGV